MASARREITFEIGRASAPLALDTPECVIARWTPPTTIEDIP